MGKAVGKKPEKEWSVMYKELSKFFSENDHSHVPYRFQDNPKLGRWVQKQRSGRAKLTPQKINLLNRLNFVWQEDIRKEKNKQWLIMFKKLEKFKTHYGHCNVPSKYEPDKKLGRWVEVLRTRKNKLDEWKMNKLKSIGFQWSDDIKLLKERHWYEMYYKLESFYKKYGHSSVPENWEKDKKLAVWVAVQRRPKKPLAKKKVQLLNELKFKWNNDVIKRTRGTNGRFLPSLQK